MNVPLRFEWDLWNSRKIAGHGLSRTEIEEALSLPHIEFESSRNDELRVVALCRTTEGKYITVVYTWRDDLIMAQAALKTLF